MAEVKVSVVLTTFNGEKTLRKAIDSWLAQTLVDCEIVITDDCSKDNTRKIIAEYALKYPQKIIANYMEHNTRNSGAINRGVKTARGKYVAIVDQDDWADKTMLEKLYNAAEKENADVSTCNFVRVDFEGRMVSTEIGNTQDQLGEITCEKRKSLFVRPGSRLCKIFRKDFLMENKIEHCDNVCFGDNYFMEHVVAYCNKLVKVDEPLYFYSVGNTTVTQSKNNSILYDRVKSAELMIKSLEKRGFLNDYKQEIEFRFIELFYVNSIIEFITKFCPCELKEIKYLRSVVKNNYQHYRRNKYFKERISKRNKFILLLCDISPFLLCKSYTFYHSLKEAFKHKREGINWENT